MLLPAFYLADTWVVHLHSRHGKQSFSLSEIPLVAGLFYASPGDLIVAQLLGAGLALHLHRHQGTIKLAFNLPKMCIETCIALIIFRGLLGQADPFGPVAWGATLAAVLVAIAMGTTLTATAISLLDGRPSLERFHEIMAFAQVSAAATAALALAGIALESTRPAAMWLLAVPTVALAVAYRAYTAERRRDQGVSFLYETSRRFQRSVDVETSVLPVLAEARRMFRAELAEIVLVPAERGRDGVRAAVGPSDTDESVTSAAWDSAQDTEVRLVAGRKPRVLSSTSKESDSGDRLAQRGVRNGMEAALKTESNVMGTLLVANRVDRAGSFDREDLHLFEALAGHVSLALDKARLQERLKHQAFHDSLTGLPNRALLLDRVEHALTKRNGHGTPGVLFLDLDDFKMVNDSLGHGAGDRILAAVAQRLRSCVRPHDTVARLGGDEFGILLENVLDRREAMLVVERVLDVLRVAFDLTGERLLLHASVGVSFADREGGHAEELLRNADVAMYTAKTRGKSGYAVFEPRMTEAVIRRHAIKAELESAIENSDLIPHYQGIVNLQTGRIEAVEALVRWAHPVWGLLQPLAFVPLAEEFGLIGRMGRWVLREACQQTKAWQDQFDDHLTLAASVNISARQIREPGFVADVTEAIEYSKLDPSTLILEITESSMMVDPEAIIPRINTLRERGIRFAIDDFGTGYSSLSILQYFPVDIIKVAKPFIDNLGQTRAKQDFTTAIFTIGATLGLTMVAEGVESADQQDRLSALGCELGQGFHLIRPLPREDFERVLLGAHTQPSVAVVPPIIPMNFGRG